MLNPAGETGEGHTVAQAERAVGNRALSGGHNDVDPALQYAIGPKPRKPSTAD
jgi:hypothetical protein